MPAFMRLIFHRGPWAGREIVTGIRKLRIGSEPNCNDLVIDDASLLPAHGVIQRSFQGEYLLEDFGRCKVADVGSNVQRLPVGASFELGASKIEVANANPRLMQTSGEHPGRTIPIADFVLSFGRAADNHIELTDSEISTYHTIIQDTPLGLVIEDQRSTNGTFVNEKRITNQVLQDGDCIRIGAEEYVYLTSDRAPTTVAQAKKLADSVEGFPSAEGLPKTLVGVSFDQAKAKFVLGQQVEQEMFITIGSAPSCTLRLDGEGISAQHCRILWSGSFHVEDTSATGTYLDDSRIVRGTLLGSHVLRVGRELLDVSIQGACCTINQIDRSTALAAIEIARETAFDLRKATLQPRNSGKFSVVYKTAYKIDLADVESLVQERKEKHREQAPAWRPSGDIARPKMLKLGIALTLLSSLLLVLFTHLRGLAPVVLTNHALSAAHSSQAFAQQVDALGIAGDCGACHQSRTGIETQCLHCHDGFDRGIRAAHMRDSQSNAASRPGPQCSHCHSEHNDAPRFVNGNPLVLGAASACADPACHPRQHQGGLKTSKTPVPSAIAADPIPNFDMPLKEFHIHHSRVERKGEELNIECTSCHATQDVESENLSEQEPGRSCFGCHAEGGAEIERECLSCHGLEHGSAHGFVRPTKGNPDLRRAVTALSRWTTLRWSLVAMAVLFLPLLLLVLIVRMRGDTINAPSATALRVFPIESVKHLVHSINAEKCVGCRACVQACPTSVLELVNHKAKIVNFDACIQCKACEFACEFGALVMHDADKAAPTSMMPDLDRGHQTPIDGMYLIGQAAGQPQIKNASNMGRSVVEQAVKAGLAPGEGQRLGAQVDVLIIGSGPAGLSAALTCQRYGIQASILEKQPEFAWTIRNFFHHGKEVMSEPEDVSLVGYLPIWDTNREELLAAWQNTITQCSLNIEYRQNVTNIRKVDSIFEITISDANGQVIATRSAARVIIAIGGLGQPRTLGCPGDRLDKVRSALVDPSEFHGKDILVVGGTDSAIEVALSLCATNRVTLSCRTATFDRAKRRNLDLFQAALAEGRIEPRFGTSVVSISESAATLEDRHDGSQLPLANDYVFALIGGIPPTQWLQSLGIVYVSRSHGWSPPPSDAEL